MMKKLLINTIKLKGSCTGVTSTMIARTVSKALYFRSDGYWEAFRIKVVPEMVCVEKIWVPTGNTVEVYPSNNAFGISAWCGKEESIIRIYEGLPEREMAHSAIDVSRFSRRSKQSGPMGPLKENNAQNLKQSINSNLKISVQ
jgi:hypothetical protein